MKDTPTWGDAWANPKSDFYDDWGTSDTIYDVIMPDTFPIPSFGTLARNCKAQIANAFRVASLKRGRKTRRTLPAYDDGLRQGAQMIHDMWTTASTPIATGGPGLPTVTLASSPTVLAPPSSTPSSGVYTTTSSATATSLYVFGTQNQLTMPAPRPQSFVFDVGPLSIQLKDGSKLLIDEKGNYRIEDKDAKITYRANHIRNFNPFLNASDKIEEFIRFCGDLKVRRDEMMNLPLQLFIAWLVQEAAKADEEAIPETQLIPDLRKQTAPQCQLVSCRRFISIEKARKKILFCGPPCFEKQLALAA